MLHAYALIALAAGWANPQDVPRDIPKNELPPKAECLVCSAAGENHGMEKPAGGVRYKGAAYYFCNSREIAEFKKDPEALLPAPVPRPAPDVPLRTLDGMTTTIKEAAGGKWALVDFWATWCKPCVQALPSLSQAAKELAPLGVVVVGVAIDEPGAKVVKPFWEKRKAGYTTLVDAAENPAWKAYRVRFIPALFLVSPEGQIVREWRGGAKGARLVREVRETLAAK